MCCADKSKEMPFVKKSIPTALSEYKVTYFLVNVYFF
ncbi:hypothetical protein SAMN05660206_1067 [Sphingobacterium wenxiniae]|uniref:Uncharacterized protein n=1 Tax=Sphingobacterium wenxiniae TaxID=683125 RepID=A0A1I6T8J2_9SPHI|nr:hypothetical protein SAMN05660206_1067 [Sphingobacterium wenxiniae]